MFLGAGGGVVLHTAAGFGGEEETPKPSPSLGKDTVERIHIHLQLASHPCIPRSGLRSARGEAALPSQRLCPSRDAPLRSLSQFLHPDLITEITGTEENKSGLPLGRL